METQAKHYEALPEHLIPEREVSFSTIEIGQFFGIPLKNLYMPFLRIPIMPNDDRLINAIAMAKPGIEPHTVFTHQPDSARIYPGPMMNPDIFDELLQELMKDSGFPLDDKLRFREHQVKLTNQAIIEFAYLTKNLIELYVKDHTKLFFEEANCYLTCFYKIRELLKLVDSEYIELHPKIMDFYQDGRELSNDFDRLRWKIPDSATINIE